MRERCGVVPKFENPRSDFVQLRDQGREQAQDEIDKARRNEEEAREEAHHEISKARRNEELARREASEAQHREEEAYAKIAELTERLRALQYSGP